MHLMAHLNDFRALVPNRATADGREVYQNRRRCQIIVDLNMRRHEPQSRGLCGQLISRLLDLVYLKLFKMPL